MPRHRLRLSTRLLKPDATRMGEQAAVDPQLIEFIASGASVYVSMGMLYLKTVGPLRF